MGCPKPVAVDLLADLPADVDTVPAQSMPPLKPKRIKKAQPKAKATVVETEDTLPISQLAGSKKTSSAPAKKSAETQPAESSKSKKARSSSATTSGSKKPDVPWAPKITLEDRPIMSSESADDINVGVALSTALLLPGDLERNAEYTEAIRKVAEAEKIEAEDRKAQVEKELQEALATKDVEIKEADEKAYAQGMADVTEEYKLQKLDLLADSPFRNADAIPLPFPPPPPPSQPEDASESEDEDGGEDEDEAETLVRKPREAVGTKSPSLNEQGSSDVPQVNKSIDETLAEIDAEIAADKEAEVSLQETSEVQIQPDANIEKS
ncbi:radixin-like [Camellia sinensis]|uniref:radixin-like n=1 Tax=Camellia sinensis TaxID=4442 RepID=UPI0010359AF7|nr:radixin-like [Camellia sinensis]